MAECKPLLTFHPVTPCQLDGGGVYCKLHSGKYEYILKLAGTGAAPNLRFSFLEHDFASCFTVTPGQPPHKETVVLRVSNQDPESELVAGLHATSATRSSKLNVVLEY